MRNIQRIALGVAYDGGAYHGWQVQGALKTVQGQLEQALSQVAAQPISVVGSGRTDLGVHALAQTLHFDTTAYRPQQAWVRGSNHYLPPDIRVLWASAVTAEFHARFSAISRHYRYVIYQQELCLPWFRRYVLWHRYTLNVAQMQQAAQSFLGEHDFSALRAASCQSQSPIRRINQLTVESKLPWIGIDVVANAFLQHMVRNIVGVLLEVGQGRRLAHSISELLTSRDRQQAAATARAQGLYLYQVHYPSYFGLPSPPNSALDINLSTPHYFSVVRETV